MIKTNSYARKPLHVKAVQVSPENISEVSAWCKGVLMSNNLPSGGSAPFIKVDVHRPMNERQTKAFVGDFILQSERGFKVYTEKAFYNSFDVLEETVLIDSGQPELTGLAIGENPVGLLG